MKKTSAITCLLLDVGGVLLTNGRDPLTADGGEVLQSVVD